MYRFPKTNNQLTPRNQVTPWLGKPFIISASEGAGLAVGLSWYLFTNQRGNHWVLQWSSISWTWQVHSVTNTFWLDWQNTTQIGNLSHIQKWKTLLMSKDMPMARCCIFPPKSGKTTFTKKNSRPNSVCKYIYIYTYIYTYEKTLLSSWKQNANTYTFLVAGPLNPNIQPLKAFQPIETTCHLCRHHFDLVSFGLQLLIYLIPSSQKPTNLLWSKNIICVCVCVRVCVCVCVCVKSIQYPICCDMNCRNNCYQNWATDPRCLWYTPKNLP